MGKMQRNKGKVGEREVAEIIKQFGWPARRGQQRSGVDQADVIDGPPGWHFEVKRTERLNLHKAVAQAKRDAPKGDAPVVVTRRNMGQWLAVVDFALLLDLIATKLNAARGVAVVEIGSLPKRQRRHKPEPDLCDLCPDCAYGRVVSGVTKWQCPACAARPGSADSEG